MKKRYTLKQILYFSFGIVGISFFLTLQMKANIGVSPWDALILSLSNLTLIKVGTVSMAMSVFAIVIQLILGKSKIKLELFLQILAGILIGFCVNFFYYEIFGNLVLSNYLFKLLIFIIGVLGSSFCVSIVVTSDFISLSLEEMCKVIAIRINRPFSQVRQLVDFISVVLALLLSIFLSLPLTLREGTIISMLSFGPLMGFHMPRLTQWLRSHSIVPLPPHDQSSSQS